MSELDPVNFNKAIKAFIQTYTDLEAQNIILGYQNNVVLPETEDYAVFHIIRDEVHGKGDSGLIHDEQGDFYYLLKTRFLTVQIDLYCENNNRYTDLPAMRRCQELEAVANSELGVSFFNQYGLSCLGSNSMKADFAAGDSGILEFRWILELRLSYNSKYKYATDSFSAIDLQLHPEG